METLTTIIRLFLSSIPFAGLCIAALKINLKKEQRYKQVALPLVALVYCTVAVILLNNITDFLLGAVYWLSENLSFLSFLNDVNWAYYVVFIVNSALATGFVLIKSFLLPILAGIFSNKKLADVTSGKFYYVLEADEENSVKNVRYLKEKFRNAKQIIQAMYWTMLVIFVILLVATYYMTSTDVFSAPFYPAFGLIVLGEIVAFLSGITYKEKEEKGEVPEEDPKIEIDYDSLADKYKEAFGSRLIQSYNDRPVSNIAESANDLLQHYKKEYEETLSHNAGLIYSYYSDKMDKDGKGLDEGYFGQVENLLEGKSVIFFTQFYKDTTDYVFLPVVRNLMKRKRVLVILGHSGSTENIKQWIYSGITSINGFEKIWNAENISDANDDTSIIIIDAKNIYNQKLINEKAYLLSEVSTVFIIEPARLLGTLQIGLSNLVSCLRRGGNDPQYIVYDQNCDGLVDSLSHVLNKSLVQVNATSIGTANKNMLFWKADGKLLHHKLGLTSSRYLGVGTELAIVALKDKVPKVTWAASRKFPVVDMRWIAMQYYASICKAADLKVSQNELSSHIDFISDPWSMSKVEDSVVVVEDEFNNAFEVARQFATRGEKQSFVNVISHNYWLREYMTDNMEIFKQDPKAIPAIVADYQRNATNVVYKLIIRMIENPVSEQEIRDVLDFLGENVDNAYIGLKKLILKYVFRVDGSENEAKFIEKIDNAITVTSQVVVDKKELRPYRENRYTITNKTFISEFLSQLKIVYYIAEDEQNRDNFLDSAMYGHVCQKYLPGMLVSLDGKSYEIVNMTQNNGVIVRRAADHITNRYYYRILKGYNIEALPEQSTSYSKRSYRDMIIEHIDANIRVDTFGYLKMTEYNDIKNASRIELGNVEPREYRRKECLRISLPGVSRDVKVTLATLMNELFVTIFPNDYNYIVATTKNNAEDGTDGLIPRLDGVDDDCIYIIEDSLIDLGLLNNVDRYLVRIMEIICDVLDWHKEKMASESTEGAPSPEPEAAEDGGEEEEPKSSGGGVFGFIKRLFRRKKKKRKNTEDTADSGKEEETASQNKAVSFAVCKNDSCDGDDIGGSDSESVTITEGDKSADEDLPYSQTFFLLYGYDAVPDALNIDATSDFLKEQGFGDNYLSQTRKSDKYKKMKWYNYHFEDGVHYCDFCGAELGGTFDLLDDGRERCPDCSKEAITKLADFKKLYKKTKKQMEKIFGIKIKAKITIRTCNAQKIAEFFGETFTPSPVFDGRTLGFAHRHGNANDIYIENGSPAVETAKTLVHELTHIWQYANMPDLFNENKDLVVIEGMSVWAEVQYLSSIGLKDRAAAYVCNRLMQDNEYGIGLKEYLDRYPISDKETVTDNTPFTCKGNPLR